MRLSKFFGDAVSTGRGKAAAPAFPAEIERLADDGATATELENAVSQLADFLKSSEATPYEAHLLAVRLPALMRDRRRAVAATLRLSSADGEFQKKIRLADAARDQGHWGEGEALYFEALRDYPLHHGYAVQYAHCQKEQGKDVEADIYYRTALALGELNPDLIRHLDFVASRSGSPVSEARIEAIRSYWSAPTGDGNPLDAPPTKDDVLTAWELLIGHGPGSAAELRAVMADAATNADVLRLLMGRPNFPLNNRDLMVLLAETDGASR